MNINHELLKVLIEQKDLFSIYAAFDLLEYAFQSQLEEIPLSELEIKGNVSIAISSSDISQVKIKGDSIILFINNLSIFGIQGAMPIWYTEELMHRNQMEDEVLSDFVDIFNSRIAKNLYKLQKNHHFCYYPTELIEQLSQLFLEKKEFLCEKGLPIFASRVTSGFTLASIISKMVGPEVSVELKKASGRWAEIEKCQLPCKLGKTALGRRLWINDMVVVILKCQSVYKYELLLNDKTLDALISQYCNSYQTRVILERVKYRAFFLNNSRLRAGICL